MFFAYSIQSVSTSPTDAQPNKCISVKELYTLITDPTSEAAQINRKIAQISAHYFELNSDYKDVIKPLIEPLKKQLPYILPSGFCPKHHNNETLAYNSIVQLDIDIKRKGGAMEVERIFLALKSLSKVLPYIVLAAKSPTGYGLKIFALTDNAKVEYHTDAFYQICKALCNILQIQKSDIDVLGISQPCFLPTDTTAYINENATPFHVVMSEKNVPSYKPVQNNYSDTQSYNTTLAAVNFLVSNKIDLAHEYHEFINVTMGCINTFGDEIGREYANQIYSTSPKYNNDSKKYIRKLSVREAHERKVTGATIVYYAKKYGFNPIHQQVTIKEVKTIRGAQGDFVMQILERNNVEQHKIFGQKWIAPTGCGKSFLIKELAKKYKIVVVCPSIALVNQYQKEGAVGYYFQNRVVSNANNFIAVTYSSLYLLSNIITTNDYHLIFDECHNFTSGEFMIKQLRSAANEIKKYKDLTQFTATDIYIFDERLIQNTTIIEIPKPTKKLFLARFEDDILYNIAKLIRTSIEQGRLPYILLNDTCTKLATVKNFIGEIDGLVCLDSTKKKGDNFQSIIKNKKLPIGTKCLITTTVIKEGNDIFDNVKLDFIPIGAFHAIELEQALNRFRNAEDVSIYICKGKEVASVKPFDLNSHKKAIYYSTENAVCELNTSAEEIGFDIRQSELYVSQRIKPLPMFLDKDSNTYQLCEIQAACKLFEREKHYQYGCDDAQITALGKYGFINQQIGNVSTHEPTKIETKDKDKATQAAKAIEKEQYRKAIQAIENSADAGAMVRAAKVSTLAKAERKAVTRTQSLCDQFNIDANESITLLSISNDAGELLTESDLDFKKLSTRLHVLRCEADKKFMESDRKKTILFKAIRNRFEVDKVYTSDEIIHIMTSCIKVDNSIDFDGLGSTEQAINRKLYQILSYFYEVSSLTCRIGEKYVKCFVLDFCDPKIYNISAYNNGFRVTKTKEAPKKGKQIHIEAILL